MHDSLGKGSLKPMQQKHMTVFKKVGYNPTGAFPPSKSSKPNIQTQAIGAVQQLQCRIAAKKETLPGGKSSKAQPDLKSVSPPGGGKPKGKLAKKKPSKVSSSKQKQPKALQKKKQPINQKLNKQSKRETGSGAVKRRTTKDDEDRAEMVSVKTTLCSDGYTCQKFAFKPKVKKSKEICLRMIEEIDTKTGSKDYRLTWSKQKKSFSIINELKSVTRGFDASPVLQRNQTNLRDFTILGKQALKSHCISFHFRNRSLDLVFKHVETAESLEKLVNFLRDKGGL